MYFIQCLETISLVTEGASDLQIMLWQQLPKVLHLRLNLALLEKQQKYHW